GAGGTVERASASHGSSRAVKTGDAASRPGAARRARSRVERGKSDAAQQVERRPGRSRARREIPCTGSASAGATARTGPTPARPSATHVQVALEEGHGPEPGLSERARIHGKAVVQSVPDRLSRSEPDRGVREARQIREADRNLDRNDRVLPGREREPERKVDGRGPRVFEGQIALERGERESEAVRILDARPETDRRAAERTLRGGAEEPQLGRPARDRLEPGRLDLHQLGDRRTAADQRQQGDRDEAEASAEPLPRAVHAG